MIKEVSININYNLRNPSADDETPINLVIRFGGVRIVHPTGERIHPKNWESDKTKGKNFQKAKKSFADLNSRLDDKKVKVQKAFSKFRDEQNRIPTSDEFKEILATLFGQGKSTDLKKVSFLDFIRNHIQASLTRANIKTGQPISPNTIKPYKTVLMHLEDFQKETRTKVNWESLNNDFYRKFNDYLYGKNMKVNSIGKQWQNINAFIRQAEAQSVIPYGKIRSFPVLREQVDNISLTKEELKALETLDLSDAPRLDKVRDLFLVGCYTASRYSDLHKYTPDAIRVINGKQIFEVVQQKTQQSVSVPVHKTVKQIHEKYGGSLPKVPSDQKMNEYLKELAFMIPAMHKPFEKKHNTGGKIVVTKEPRYKYVCTHTARRTFATHQIENGIPVYLVMHATGHKTEKDFWRYIKMDNKAKGLQLLEYWEKAV